jgi:hypothetical protein
VEGRGGGDGEKRVVRHQALAVDRHAILFTVLRRSLEVDVVIAFGGGELPLVVPGWVTCSEWFSVSFEI